MGRGPADEAVVTVKPGACEPMVTSVRLKQRASAMEAEVKGGIRKGFWRLIRDCGQEIGPKGSLRVAGDVGTGRIAGAHC
jgi:hypothetical protein